MFKNELVRNINKFLNRKQYSLLFTANVLGEIPTEYHEGGMYVLLDYAKVNAGKSVQFPVYGFLLD